MSFTFRPYSSSPDYSNTAHLINAISWSIDWWKEYTWVIDVEAIIDHHVYHIKRQILENLYMISHAFIQSNIADFTPSNWKHSIHAENYLHCHTILEQFNSHSRWWEHLLQIKPAHHEDLIWNKCNISVNEFKQAILDIVNTITRNRTRTKIIKETASNNIHYLDWSSLTTLSQTIWAKITMINNMHRFKAPDANHLHL